jgi:polar amino acid transport system substrate-binding protein
MALAGGTEWQDLPHHTRQNAAREIEMTIRPFRLGAVAAIAAALVLSGCGDDDDSGGGDTTTEGSSDLELVSEGTLTVCSDIPYPPFEIEDPDSPSGYSGFDIDVMQAIADGLELELAVQDVSFDALQSGAVLQSGQCDVGASAMTITEERKANIDFSDPYYDSLQSLLVPEGSDIASIDDLAGKQVGVQAGTTGKMYAEENAPEGTTIVDFPSDGELWPAMQSGSIDAILQDLPVNVEHTREGGYEIVEEFDTGEQYGYAFAKGENPNLLEAVNEQLQSLRDDGSYDEMYEKYFSAEAS